MLRKSLMLAVAAAAAFGATLVTPTASDAAPGMRGRAVHVGGGAHFGGGGHMRPRLPHRPPHMLPRPHRPHVHIHMRRPIYRGAPIVAAAPVVYAVSRPVAAAPRPCTCLSKEYTPEGSVLFKDLCTNEMAMNPPLVAPQQTSQIAPQLQPQYQVAPQMAPQEPAR